MKHKCRVCMSSSVTLMDIFAKGQQKDEEDNEPSLAEMIKECVNHEINENDGFPKKICITCILDAQNAYRFKRRFQRSYEQLRLELENEAVEDLMNPLELAVVQLVDTDIEQQMEIKDEIEEEQYIIMDSSPVSMESVSNNSEHRKFKCQQLKPCRAQCKAASSPRSPHHQCETCSKTLKTKAKLIIHNRIHTGECPFLCPHCGKTFNQSSHLTEHIRIHTGEFPYKCTHCPKAFHTPSNLHQHMNTHSNDRPHQCPHCPRNYSKKNDLRLHILSHADKRCYACPHCLQRFVTNYELKIHKMVHNNEHPHQCPHCPKRFARSAYLRQHVRTHTGERPYKCPLCPKTFNQQTPLSTHLRIHARNDSTSLSSAP